MYWSTSFTGIVRGWLRSLRKSGTPLIVGTVLLPVQVFDTASENLGNVIYRYNHALQNIHPITDVNRGNLKTGKVAMAKFL